MQIDLTKAFARDDHTLSFETELEMNSIVYGGEQFEILKKEPVKLTVHHAKKRCITVSGVTNLEIAIPCDRCLKDVSVSFAVDLNCQIDFENLEENPEQALEISNFMEENMLDVDALVCNEIMVLWPTKILCSASCKGICKKCGKNLNEGSCNCDQTELDPRMAAIRDIFYENYKEEV